MCTIECSGRVSAEIILDILKRNLEISFRPTENESMQAHTQQCDQMITQSEKAVVADEYPLEEEPTYEEENSTQFHGSLPSKQVGDVDFLIYL